MFVTKLQAVLASKKSFIQDKLNYSSLGTAAVLNIIHWIFLYIKIKPTDTRILLHYNVLIGADIVSSAKYIFLIPIVALLFFIINIWLAAVYYKKEKLPAYFLNIASIAVQLIFFIASLVLIIANAA